MNFYYDPIMQLTQSELIEQVSYRSGLTTSQVAALIDSELEMNHILAYLTAVISDRMN
jgi:hypothetical protein